MTDDDSRQLLVFITPCSAGSPKTGPNIMNGLYVRGKIRRRTGDGNPRHNKKTTTKGQKTYFPEAAWSAPYSCGQKT